MVSQILSWITPNLQSGPLGVLALTAVTWSVVLPLTLYKKVWGIGVAYGFSVCAAGLTLLQLFASSSLDPLSASSLLAKACVVYGARLGGYVLLRDLVRKKPSAVKNGSVFSRVTFSLSLSLFYALLTTPALYAMRHPSESMVAMGGAVLAIVGVALEAIADAQKFVVKSKNNHVEGDFVGPTGGAFAITRHPNYLGEILFWVGLFVGGAPSFGKHAVAWISSGLGLMGIVSIMLKATSGLEKRQSEKYTGQEKYDKWKAQVKYPLFPFVNS
jgi:steroid 5-alpha reductase family enzyme